VIKKPFCMLSRTGLRQNWFEISLEPETEFGALLPGNYLITNYLILVHNSHNLILSFFIFLVKILIITIPHFFFRMLRWYNVVSYIDISCHSSFIQIIIETLLQMIFRRQDRQSAALRRSYHSTSVVTGLIQGLLDWNWTVPLV